MTWIDITLSSFGPLFTIIILILTATSSITTVSAIATRGPITIIAATVQGIYLCIITWTHVIVQWNWLTCSNNSYSWLAIDTESVAIVLHHFKIDQI